MLCAEKSEQLGEREPGDKARMCNIINIVHAYNNCILTIIKSTLTI